MSKYIDAKLTGEIAFNLQWQDVMNQYDQETMAYGEFGVIRKHSEVRYREDYKFRSRVDSLVSTVIHVLKSSESEPRKAG